MEHSDILVSFLLIAIVAFQIWVTLKVRRSSEYDAGQKSAQTKLIWLVPVFGAAIAFAVLEEDDKKGRGDSNHQG